LKVRLSNYEIRTIKDLSKEIFGECEVYVFGSRLREKKGGDIDLFIRPKNKENLFEKRLKLAAKLESILGKPVDVVVDRGKNRPIEEEGRKGVKL